MNLLTTAQQYHTWGANVTAVANKRPVHPWKKWQVERQKPQDVNRLTMWERTAGVGAISGVNGWRCIDIDKSSDTTAVRYFLGGLGLPSNYPWVVRTGSGNGWAIWLVCHEPIPPGRLSSKSNKEPGVFWFNPQPETIFNFDHIELRWANCQTLLPPSKHPTGPGYQWLNGSPSEPPAVVALDVVLSTLEAIGVNRHEKEPEPAPALTTPPAQASPAQHSPNYLNGTVETIKQKLDILATARRLFAGEAQDEPGGEVRILGNGGLLLKPKEQVFYNFAGEVGGDVLDLYGLNHYGLQWDRTAPEMFKTVLQFAADDAGVELAQVASNGSKIQELPPPEGEPLFPTFNLSAGLQLPETEYLVYGAIGAGDIGMIYGDAAAGKTYLSIDLAVSMAAGLPWMGRWQTSQPRKILYFISEGRRRFFRRVLAAVNGMGARGCDVSEVYRRIDQNLAIVTEVPQLFNQDAARHVTKYVDYWRGVGSPHVDFVFIDTLHRASVGAEENDSKDAGIVVDAVTWLQKQLNGCGAGFVHHSNKSGGYRGSTAYRGNVDFVFKVEGVHREPRKMSIDKLRDGEQDGPIEGVNYMAVFKVDDTSGGTFTTWLSDKDAAEFSDKTASNKAQAIAQIKEALTKEGELSINKLAGEVNAVSKNTAVGYIKELISTGDITTTEGERNSQICSLTQFG